MAHRTPLGIPPQGTPFNLGNPTADQAVRSGMCPHPQSSSVGCHHDPFMTPPSFGVLGHHFTQPVEDIQVAGFGFFHAPHFLPPGRRHRIAIPGGANQAIPAGITLDLNTGLKARAEQGR